MSEKMKKTQMHRVLSMMLAGAMIAGVLAGCGTPTGKDEQGRTVISVGNWPQTEGSRLDRMNARKASFEANNPDVVIQPDAWTFDLKTFYAKAAGGQLPDLYATTLTEMKQIQDAEYSANLTDVMKKRGYEGKFNPKILEVVSNEEGDIYGFPYSTYVLGMAYNTEHFKAAGLLEADGTPKQPKTWDEVVEFAIKIKEATGKPGFVFPTANKNGGWIFTCLAWSFGVDFMEQDENGKWKATFNTPEAAEALQWIKDLKWKHNVLPSNTLIDGTEYYKLLATGNAAMLITAGDVPQKLVSYGMTPDQVGMLALPAGPKRHVTLLGGKAYSVSDDATEKQIDAAIRWIETSEYYEVTDEFKMNQENSIKSNLEENVLVGIQGMCVWNSDVATTQFLHDLIEKNANSNLNHVKRYNEFVETLPCEIQPEEPVCAQELYGVLDDCIQEVLINENANCAELLEKANADFQANYLDNISY